MLIIDGTTYNVPIKALKRKAEFLDDYAKRTENGDLQRKLIGVYYNYELQLGWSLNNPDYNALWDKITEPVEFHQVTIPYQNYSFTAYVSNISDNLKRVTNQKGTNLLLWEGLTVNFIAKSPARR